MSFALGLLVGGVVGVLVERLVGRPFDRVTRHLGRRSTRRRQIRTERHLRVTGEVLQLSGRSIFVHQHTQGGFPLADCIGVLRPDEDLESRYGGSAWSGRLGSLAELKMSVNTECDRLSGDQDQWNGNKIRLVDIGVPREPDTERPRLRMVFSTTDHATFVAVGNVWSNAGLVTELAGNADLLRSVDPLLSNSFGVNCTVITADGQLIVTRRSNLTSGGHGQWHTSMNEGVSLADVRPGSKVDVAAAFVRGMDEELGIAFQDDVRQRLLIHSLILDVDRYEWALLGHVDLRDTKWTAAQLRATRGLGEAVDDWESRELRFVPWSPADVIAECSRHEEWIPHGLVNVVLSAVVAYPSDRKDISAALLGRT